MTQAESLSRAIHEPVTLVESDPAWPQRFDTERRRLAELAPELSEIDHIGSTAVAGLPAKPVIDLMAVVPSMKVADVLVRRLCDGGYTTSDEFNRSLGDRRWLMRHADGRRTHHLHLVLPESAHRRDAMRFRDALRADPQLLHAYIGLKRRLAADHGSDREAYTAAKGAFIAAALAGDGPRLPPGYE